MLDLFFRGSGKEHLVTAEVFNGDGLDANQVFAELKSMGILPSDAGYTFSRKDSVQEGFPIPTLDFYQQSDTIVHALTSQFDNLVIAGKGSGKNFFMNQVITNIYETLAGFN